MVLGGTMRGVTMSLRQTGTRVVGVVRPEGGGDREVEGTISGATLTMDARSLHYHGTIDGDRMDGMVNTLGLGIQFTVVRVKDEGLPR